MTQDADDRREPPQIGAPIPIPPANTATSPDDYGVSKVRRLSAQAAEAAQHVVEVEIENQRLTTQLKDMEVRARHAESIVVSSQQQLAEVTNELDYFKRRLMRLQTWLETLGAGLVTVMKDGDPEHIIAMIDESRDHNATGLVGSITPDVVADAEKAIAAALDTAPTPEVTKLGGLPKEPTP